MPKHRIEVNPDKSTVHALLLESCKTYYVNLKETCGHLISSVLVELD